MYEFEVLGQDAPLHIEAINLEEARKAAASLGVAQPALRLRESVRATSYRATYDARTGILSVTLPEDAEQALAFLRGELGFRQREGAGPGCLSALWQPEREDGVGGVLGLFIERIDGLGEEAPPRGTPEYYAAMAAAWLAEHPSEPRALWRKLEVLATREEAWRNDKSDPLASRWAARLSEQLEFLRAVCRQANADLVAMLAQVETGDEVKVDGEWHRVVRINQKSLRIQALDSGALRTVKRDRVEDWRDGEPLAKPAIVPVNPGDFVFHRTGWYEVADVKGQLVTARNSRRQVRLLRYAIGNVRSPAEHRQALLRDRKNARRLDPV